MAIRHVAGSIPATVPRREPSPAPPAGSPTPPWYRRSLVGMEVGPTGAQFRPHSDPTTPAMREVRRPGNRAALPWRPDCQYVVLWARDGDWAYYNSKLLPKPPGLGNRDPLRDAVDEAHKQRPPADRLLRGAAGRAFSRRPSRVPGRGGRRQTAGHASASTPATWK